MTSPELQRRLTSNQDLILQPLSWPSQSLWQGTLMATGTLLTTRDAFFSHGVRGSSSSLMVGHKVSSKSYLSKEN